MRAYIFQAKDQLSGLGYPFDSDHSARSGDVSQLVFSRDTNIPTLTHSNELVASSGTHV